MIILDVQEGSENNSQNNHVKITITNKMVSLEHFLKNVQYNQARSIFCIY